MAKISAFERYYDTTIRHEQVVYLNSYGINHRTIAKITGYALSTVKTLVRKCINLLELAKKRFYVITKKALKEFDPTIKYVQAAPDRMQAKRHNNTIVNRGFKNYKDGNAFAYVFTFFDANKKPVFLKIGKTKEPMTRLKNEIPYYRKSRYNVSYAIINKLILCPNDDRALTVENALREHYKKQSCAYVRNDRFLDMAFDIDDLREDNFLKKTISLCCAV